MKSIKIRKKIDDKRSYRNIRSYLKSRIRRNAKIDHETIIKYNLHGARKYILFFFCNGKKIVRDTIRISVPEYLCLVKDHNVALNFIRQVELTLNSDKPVNLYIDHRNTKYLGLSASYIFDKRLRDYLRYWKNKGYDIKIRGDISDVKEVNNFILSFGFLADLDIVSNFDTEHVDLDYKNKFEMFKAEGNSDKEHLKGNASTELAGYFKKCFNYCNLDLTAAGVGKLSDAFGEIIGNAEEHNKDKPTKWHVLGCYNKDSKYCSFAIINSGTTIFQSLSDEESTSSEVLQEVSGIIKSNKSMLKNIAERGKSGIEEPLWNVLALQDGISSKRQLEGTSSSRGVGLMDVLEFIEELKSNDGNCYVSVISGRSKIIIDYDYPIKEVPVGDNNELRRQIAFNSAGSFYEEQDPQKVFYMDGSFLGTVITGKFKINEEFLVSKLENLKNGKNDTNKN